MHVFYKQTDFQHNHIKTIYFILRGGAAVQAPPALNSFIYARVWLVNLSFNQTNGHSFGHQLTIVSKHLKKNLSLKINSEQQNMMLFKTCDICISVQNPNNSSQHQSHVFGWRCTLYLGLALNLLMINWRKIKNDLKLYPERNMSSASIF